MEQIIIECLVEDDGSFAWEWSIFGVEECIASGSAKTLGDCVSSMQYYLTSEGLI